MLITKPNFPTTSHSVTLPYFRKRLSKSLDVQPSGKRPTKSLVFYWIVIKKDKIKIRIYQDLKGERERERRRRRERREKRTKKMQHRNDIHLTTSSQQFIPLIFPSSSKLG